MPHRTACIHIGTHKTGTSTIQRFLFKNRNVLKNRAIAITSTRWGMANYADLRIATCVPEVRQSLPYSLTGGIVRRGLFWENITPELQERQLKKIRHMVETKHRNDRLVIFSDETLSTFHENEIEKVKELMSPLFDNIVIILYLRRQPELLVSWYYTLVSVGMPFSFHDYLNMPEEVSLLAYRNIVERWSIFGKENIKIRIFDKQELHENDLLSDFAAAAGFETAGLQRVKNENVSSLDSTRVEFLRLLNTYCPKLEGALTPSIDRSVLARVFKKTSAKNEKAYHLSRDEARQILDTHRAGNDWIAQEYLGKEELFNDDVSMYPVAVVSPHHLTVERCAELTASLWKESGRLSFVLERLVRNFLERPLRSLYQTCCGIFKGK